MHQQEYLVLLLSSNEEEVRQLPWAAHLCCTGIKYREQWLSVTP
jgi:hypothetical protein